METKDRSRFAFIVTVLFSALWLSQSSAWAKSYSCQDQETGHAWALAAFPGEFLHISLRDVRADSILTQDFAEVIEPGVTRLGLQVLMNWDDCDHQTNEYGQSFVCGADAVQGRHWLVMKCGQEEFDDDSSLYFECHGMLPQYEPATIRMDPEFNPIEVRGFIPGTTDSGLPFAIQLQVPNLSISRSVAYDYRYQDAVSCFNNEDGDYR